MQRYDIAIIGTGPAGLSAAINAAVRGKSIILFGNKELSMKVEKAPMIMNYLGLPSVTGEQLRQAFARHLDVMGIPICEELVGAVYPMGSYFSILASGNFYEASAVILALGVQTQKELPGEERFLGRGVGYCATCDAPLYRGKTVTVIAYNRHGVEEANFISEIAAKVYFISMLREPFQVNERIEVVEDTPVEIAGEEKVTGLKLKHRILPADGVFIFRDSIAPGKLVAGLHVQNGHITVDENMRTNLEGCFAAGDITGRPYQYMRAAGQGQVAALQAAAFLDLRKQSK